MDTLDYNRGRLRVALQTITDIRIGILKGQQFKTINFVITKMKRLLLCLDMAAKYRNQKNKTREYVSLSYIFTPSNEYVHDVPEYNLNKLQLTILILKDLNLTYFTSFQHKVYKLALQYAEELQLSLQPKRKTSDNPKTPPPPPPPKTPHHHQEKEFDPIPYVSSLWQAISSLWQTYTQSDLKKAYHALAVKFHPDKVRGSGAHDREVKYAEEVMKILHSAMDLIKEERKWS